MRTAEEFYNIFMYSYNKNILEYGQIARNGTESMIPDIEGRSRVYPVMLCFSIALFFPHSIENSSKYYKSIYDNMFGF